MVGVVGVFRRRHLLEEVFFAQQLPVLDEAPFVERHVALGTVQTLGMPRPVRDFEYETV